MYENFAKFVLEHGGEVKPLIIPAELTNGTGTMNPSIISDNGKLRVILRHVNYTFYHSERKLFHHPFGPLTYLHPENDVKLRTWNYYLELDDDLNVSRYNQIDTSKFPEKELWDFIGLEDARIVKWEDKYYTTGVRRDLDDIGTGRMELCEIDIRDDSVVELSRFRIPPPNNPDSYCEKNWMPIVDQPFTYVKWSNPTEVVKVDPLKQTCWTTYQGKSTAPIHRDLRGGSQVIPLPDGNYIALTHEVDLFQSETDRKDAVYRHRFVIWDSEWNLIKYSNDFSIMNGAVEFAVGMCKHGDDYMITYGFQDNAAFVMRVPETLLMEFLQYEY